MEEFDKILDVVSKVLVMILCVMCGSVVSAGTIHVLAQVSFDTPPEHQLTINTPAPVVRELSERETDNEMD